MSDRVAPGGPLFWTGAAVGWSVMAFGVIGALGISADTHPRSLGIWVIGSLLVHDLVVAPVVFLVGTFVRRTVPAPAGTWVRAAMIVTAILVLISIPVIGRFGARRDNPTLLPRDAGTGLLLAVGVVWLLACIAMVIAWRRGRRS